jgi:hypothetical protein
MINGVNKAVQEKIKGSGHRKLFMPLIGMLTSENYHST